MTNPTSPESGGPAFPSKWTVKQHGMIGGYTNVEQFSTGISVRDYFAAKAMAGLSANPEFMEKTFDQVADWSYKQADAMLKARGAP